MEDPPSPGTMRVLRDAMEAHKTFERDADIMEALKAQSDTIRADIARIERILGSS